LYATGSGYFLILVKPAIGGCTRIGSRKNHRYDLDKGYSAVECGAQDGIKEVT
jgi:hypothetical protein